MIVTHLLGHRDLYRAPSYKIAVLKILLPIPSHGQNFVFDRSVHCLVRCQIISTAKP
jgi:hypothetical protein